VALSLREPPRVRASRPTTSADLGRQLLAVGRTLTIQPTVRYVVLYRSVINAVPFVLVFLLLQPYAKGAGAPLASFGLLFMAVRLAAMGATVAGGKLKDSTAWWWLMVTLVIMLACGLPSALSVSWAGIAGIACLSALGSFQVPYLSALFNRNVTSDIRATALSGQAMLSTLVLLAFDPLAGVLASRLGVNDAIAVLLGVLALGLVPLLLLRVHLTVRHKTMETSGTAVS
jgi:hypothetical protein